MIYEHFYTRGAFLILNVENWVQGSGCDDILSHLYLLWEYVLQTV